MARIKGVDIPNDKHIEIALTYVYGIGRKRSNKIFAIDSDKNGAIIFKERNRNYSLLNIQKGVIGYALGIDLFGNHAGDDHNLVHVAETACI